MNFKESEWMDLSGFDDKVFGVSLRDLEMKVFCILQIHTLNNGFIFSFVNFLSLSITSYKRLV